MPQEKYNFLDTIGLSTFLTQLYKLFATKQYMNEVKEQTDPYIFDIDYSVLAFDTNMVVTGGISSGMLGVGALGTMILGNG